MDCKQDILTVISGKEHFKDIEVESAESVTDVLKELLEVGEKLLIVKAPKSMTKDNKTVFSITITQPKEMGRMINYYLEKVNNGESFLVIGKYTDFVLEQIRSMCTAKHKTFKTLHGIYMIDENTTGPEVDTILEIHG